MKKYSDLLIEIGCEELPAVEQPQLIEDFANNLSNLIKENNLDFASIKQFVTPRRLSLIIKNIQVKQEDREEIRKGPAVKSAFNERGEPTKATLGFAKSCGVDYKLLQKMDSDKGQYLCYKVSFSGIELRELLPQILDRIIAKLPKYRTMRWKEENYRFVRPIRWLILMLDDKVIEWNAFDLSSSNITWGHRFYNKKPLRINHCNEYEKQLEEEGYVIACPLKRRERILKEANKISKAADCLDIKECELIDELVALTEYPIAYQGKFDSKFLKLPPCILESVLTLKQRYIPLVDKKNKTLSSFIFISNIKSKDEKMLIAGNQAVVTPRLKDASFFYNRDLQLALSERYILLDKLAFFGGLGDMQQKSQRCKQIVKHIAEYFDADEQTSELVQQAAYLCKCDLTSLMVQEFPELQGIIGGYYLLANNKTPTKSQKVIAKAIQEHYLPQRKEDAIPSSAAACILALADKLDTLVGLFDKGYRPGADKDPFSLKRSSLGIVRIILESKRKINLEYLIEQVITSYKNINNIKINEQTAVDVVAFINERIPAYGKEKSMDNDALIAAFYKPQNDIYTAWQKSYSMMKLKDARRLALVEINKRLKNILKKQNITLTKLNSQIMKEPAEKLIYETYITTLSKFNKAQEAGEYEISCQLLCELSDPLENFFDKVMVLCEDIKLRENRLLLLSLLHKMFLQIGDFSRLTT